MVLRKHFEEMREDTRQQQNVFMWLGDRAWEKNRKSRMLSTERITLKKVEKDQREMEANVVRENNYKAGPQPPNFTLS